MARLVLASALLLLIALGVACSESESTETLPSTSAPQTTTEATPTPSPTPVLPDPAAVLQAAVDAMAQLAAFHFEMDGDITPPDLSIAIPYSFVGDFLAPDRAQGTLSVSLAFFQIQFQVAMMGDSFYATDPTTGEWRESGEPSVPFGDPATFATGFLAAMQQPALVGVESLNGVPVYRLSGVVPAGAVTGGEFEGDLTAQFWIGTEDSLVRRITGGGTIDLGDYGGALLAAIGGEIAEGGSGGGYEYGFQIDIVGADPNATAESFTFEFTTE